MPFRLPQSRLPRLTALAICLAAPVAADDVAVLADRYGDDLAACYSATASDGLAACKGRLADPCMETEESGYSTLGMVFCTAAETHAWDAYLNAEYRQSRDWAAAMDAEDQTHFPEFANRAEALLAAQRAWIAFRDAECGLEYAVWGAGSMRQVAGSSCMLDMTADRTIALRALRETIQ